MKKVLKQTLSVLLAVVMTFTITLPAFAENSDEPQANTQTDIDYHSTNVIGDMILDNIEEEASEEELDYSIQSVAIEGKTATVELKNLNACSVVVAIYENNGGKMLASGKAEIEEKEFVANDTVTVEIETDEMPEYFYVKAFLVNCENAPLCKYFETNEYTSEFEEFMAKTTEDFDEEKVINLDESEDNNFLVVSDDATVIEAEEGKNTVAKDDYENGIYVIENADEQVKNMKKGDVFYYQYGDGENEYIIIKIENIKINGDTVTLTASEIDEISELFQFIKIDKTTTQTTFDDSTMADGVTHESTPFSTMKHDVNIDESVSFIEKWSVDIELTDNIEIGAGITGTFSAGIKFFYDFYWLDSDYYYFELTITSSVAVSVYVSGSVDETIPLGTIGFNFFGAVTADAKLSFIFEAEAELELSFTIAESVIGASYDNINGLVNKTKSSEAEFDNELNFEITFFAGFEIKPEVKVLKYAEMSLSAKTGLKTTIKESLPDPTFAIHDCSGCLDIKVDFVASVSMKIKILEIINKSTTFASFKANILTAYYSNDIGFGEGKCPNLSYAVNIYVTDENDLPLKGVVVNDEYETDVNGKKTLYLRNGKHVITIRFSNDDIRTKIIMIENNTLNLNIGVDDRVEYQSGKCGTNTKWTLYSDGSFAISGSGNMTDWGSVGAVAWYEYKSMIKTVVVSNDVNAITKYSFYECDNLSNIIIGSKVSVIGNAAFQRCTNLTQIEIPKSVKKIGMNAFFMCKNLSNISIPDTVESIGSFVFYECSFTNIDLPDNITSIEEYLFGDCRNLKNIVIPPNVKYIDEHAFGGCSSLESVTIPVNTTRINEYAFDRCTDLQYVFYEGTEEQWNKVVIEKGNECLNNAVILCTDTIAPMSLVYNDRLSACSVSNVQTETITDAVVDSDYIMVAVKDASAEDLLASSNLLYIDQKTAESEELTFEYVIDESITDYDVLVFGQKLPHYHFYDGVVTAPTCTEKGFTTYTCECGDSYVSDYVDEKGHNHTSEITTPATHTVEGVMKFTCDCGDTYTETIEKIAEHTYETVVTAPTCTDQGFTTYTCSCGDSYVDGYVDATGHNDGNKDGSCDECGEDLTVNCSHSCHSSGFVNFFWKIINFLQKLFGVQSARYCECGVDHWSK